MTTDTQPPTDRQLRAWWAQFPDSMATVCGWCGREGTKSLVQPQHPSSIEAACRHLGTPTYIPERGVLAMCHECRGRWGVAAKAKRREYLGSLPRCEVPQCRRRATHTTANGVRLCGAHLRRARQGHEQLLASLGSMAIFATAGTGPVYRREDILRMATERGR